MPKCLRKSNESNVAVLTRLHAHRLGGMKDVITLLTLNEDTKINMNENVVDEFEFVENLQVSSKKNNQVKTWKV